MKVVIAHPFQQHSFYTAAQLKRLGVLNKYFTSVYYKKGTFTYFFSKFLKGENLIRAKRRRTAQLLDEDVVVRSEFFGLVLLLFRRLGDRFYSFWYWKMVNAFNRKVFAYIKKHTNEIDAVILYDCLSGNLTKKIKEKFPKIKVVIDVSAPYASYVSSILNEESQKATYSYFDSSVKKNRFDLIKAKNNALEIKYSDGFLVASDFTKESLVFSGANSTSIYKCRYGLDKAKSNNKMVGFSKKIKIAFIGSVSLQKGADFFFKVAKELGSNDYEFHLFGFYSKKAEYFKDCNELCCFHGHISHPLLLEQLLEMDILIFPSLADGFGFSVVEALRNRCAVFCSSHAGASELIKDGYNGYVFKPNDLDYVCTMIRVLFSNRKLLNTIKDNAFNSVDCLKWDSYGESLFDSLNNICFAASGENE